MTPRHKFPPLILVFFAACALTIGAETTRTDFVLGTVCTIRIIEGAPRSSDDKVILDSAFSRLREIDDEMSANKTGTQLSAINSAAGTKAVKVADDLYYVIAKALEYSRLSDGAFDPTIGPLVKLWGIGTDDAAVPSPEAVKAALKLINWRKVKMDQVARTIKLETPGMKLDLGAIAKGYAADEISRILLQGKVKSAIIDLGGNVYVLGKKSDGKAWRIGVQDPISARGDFLGIVEGFDMTVVTSGIYERFFEKDGKRYHHILDTRSGYPVDNGLISVTIVTNSSIDADGLSTTLFALGRVAGMAIAEKLPGVAVIMIDKDKRVYLSPGTAKIFRLTNKNYSLSDKD